MNYRVKLHIAHTLPPSSRPLINALRSDGLYDIYVHNGIGPVIYNDINEACGELAKWGKSGSVEEAI